jgi:hypothetical protein
MKTYKTIDLFGNEVTHYIDETRKSNKSLFHDYEGFTDKFEAKKTTDDCYTPPEIYEMVKKYALKMYGGNPSVIVRPFMPDGDYLLVDYPEGCVVIDNPPFSILSEICRFYIKHNIKFFLFAPHLTLFSNNHQVCVVVAGCDIVYENGAQVKTSFVTNMIEEFRVVGAPELFQSVKDFNDFKKANLPKYEYPTEVLTVSMVQKFVENGVNYQLKKSDCVHCRWLDSQKNHKKVIFGSGFLLSDKAAADKAAADQVSVAKQNTENPTIIWEISPRERKIIAGLGG